MDMSEHDQPQDRTQLRLRITPHAGGEIPSRHIAVIARTAAVVIAHMQHQPNHANSQGHQRGPWARQARGLIQALHAAAHRLKQPRTIAG